MSWFNKIKIRKADKLFSEYIRTRDEWTCQRCGKKHDKSSHNFGVSHYHGRRKESVRFDGDNCISLCNMPCHSVWEHEKQDKPEYQGEYTKFMIKRLGQTGFDRLRIRANQSGGKDDALTILRIKELMKELEGR